MSLRTSPKTLLVLVTLNIFSKVSFCFTEQMSIEQPQIVRQTYAAFKRAKLDKFCKDQLSFFEQIRELSEELRANFEKAYFKENSSELLNTYNLLRELLHQPFALSLDDINYQLVEEQEQALWLHELHADWEKNNINDTYKQTLDLIYYSKSTNASNQHRLFAYNLLCSWLKVPRTGSARDIDQEWLKQQEYLLWKEKRAKKFQESGYSFLEQIETLIADIDISFKHIRSRGPSNAAHKMAFHSYNFLRELLHKQPITDIAEMDNNWIDEVLTEVRDLIRIDLYKFTRPTTTQEKLVKQALKAVGFENSLKIFVHPSDNGGSASNYIAICNNPNVNRILAVIYHELGHIIHKDFVPKIETQEFEDALNSIEMQEDISRINDYLHKVRNAIDASSKLGKHLSDILKKTTTFWVSPTNREEYLISLLNMNDERRADLFMLDTLYKLGNIDSIINQLYTYGNSSDSIVNNATTHPSDTERALYMVGFLVSKNIDVNAELKKWEEKATCIDHKYLVQQEELFTEPQAQAPEPLTQGAEDVHNAYKRYQEKSKQQS